MKTKDFLKDINHKTKDELEKIIDDLKIRLLKFKFDLIQGKVKNIRDIKKTRKNIARTLTILKIKSRHGEEKSKRNEVSSPTKK